jgi:adenylylsulfate kinase-like enzyme
VKAENPSPVFFDCLRAAAWEGMNQRARAGGIKEFTGISFPCENPENPGLARDTDEISIEECAGRAIQVLKQKSHSDKSCKQSPTIMQ